MLKERLSQNLHNKLMELFYYTYVDEEQYIQNHASGWYYYVVERVKSEVSEVETFGYSKSVEGTVVILKNGISDIEKVSQKIEKAFWKAVSELEKDAYIKWLKEKVSNKIVSLTKKLSEVSMEESLEIFKELIRYGKKLSNLEKIQSNFKN